MRFRAFVLFAVMIGLVLESSLAEVVIEGRVELPKTSAPPVVIKRYEIVTSGGIVATMPPVVTIS